MAIEGISTSRRTLVPGLAATAPYLVGMLLIYIGERVVATPLNVRLILDSIGAAGIGWAVLARLINRTKTSAGHKAAEGMILLSYLGGLLALLLYAAQLRPVFQMLRPGIEDPETIGRYRIILQILWPIIWLSSLLPLVFMEIAYAAMARAIQVEQRRLSSSAQRGLAVAWLLAALFALNYVVDKHNQHWDLTYQQTRSPSEETRRLVGNLQETLEVFLFFPEANEVREELLGYFKTLANITDRFQVRTVDRVLEPQQAQELGVKENGTVAYRYGDKKQTLKVGTTLTAARSHLSRLDQDFQVKFFSLVAEKRVAYFTTGHGERPYNRPDREDTRPPVGLLRTILAEQNFLVKSLGLGQGLAADVPDEASLVLIMDPTKDFLPEELEAVRRYLNKGGKCWISLDPEHASNIAGLADDYGLKFSAIPLAHDRFFMRGHYSKADRYNLFTNETSSHPSVTTLSRNRSRLAVVLPIVGYIEKRPEIPPGVRIVTTLRSMPMTWPDINRNMELDASEEIRKTYDIAAAVTMKITSPDEEQEEDTTEEAPADLVIESEEAEMRMLLLADGDALSDKWIRNMGNYYFFNDGLKWLFKEKEFVGKAKSNEDVRIVHTKEENIVWFYSTIFVVPVIILTVGIFYNQMRRRKKSRGEKG